MMKRMLLAMAVVLAGAQVVSAARIVPVRAKVDKVILRLEPSFKASAVGYAHKGQILRNSGSEGNWLQILPTRDVFVWVPREHLGDGVVVGARVRARSGPSIDYPVVDQLLKGEKVEVESVEQDWVKIRPPKGRVLWVHKTVVESAPDEKLSEAENDDREQEKRETDVSRVPGAPPRQSPAAKKRIKLATHGPDGADSATVGSPPAPVKASHREVVGLTDAEAEEVKAPAAIAAMGLVLHDGQGAVVKYDGILRGSALFSQSPSRFRLLTPGRGAQTICFIAGNRLQFARYVGRRIAVGGRQYWVKQCDVPVVVPQWVDADGNQARGGE
jgi:hypothetical protein